MKRPLLMVAFCYAGGVVLGNLWSFPWQVPVLLAWLFAFGFLVRPAYRARLLGPLLLLAGWANLTLHTAVISPHDLRHFIPAEGAAARVRARLLESPQHRLQELAGREVWRSTTRIEVRTVAPAGQPWRPAYGRVLVTTSGQLAPIFFAGQWVELEGVLQAPESPAVSGLFDYARYLRYRGIYYRLRIESTNDWKCRPGPGPNVGPSLPDRFANWARLNLARGLPAPEQDETVGLLWAMTLGWRTALTGEIAEPFMRSGTMHVFAISGLHVALIAGLLVGFLRVCRVPRWACSLGSLPLLWFYTAATGWQPSAIRASVMSSVILAGWSLRRPSDLLNSLAGAALILLLFNPLQLFQAGFQLSFAVSASLALFRPILEPWPKKWLQPNPLLPEKLRPRWKVWLDRPRRYLTAGLVASMAAWLGSVPLVALYFHYFTPVSILVNLLVVPLSSLALTSALGSILTGAWCPSIAVLFNHSAWLWMVLVVRISGWAAQLPGAWFHVSAPSPFALLCYYGSLGAIVAGVLQKPSRRAWAVGGFALAVGLCLMQWLLDRHQTRLTILPLSGGDSILVESAHRAQTLLIDAGNQTTAASVTLPALRARGFNRLPSLVMTHGDIRHVGGMDAVADLFHSSRVYAGAVSFRSPSYRRLESAYRSDGRLVTVRPGDRIEDWTILHPAADDSFSQADDKTLVLFAELLGTRVLLLSDLGNRGQAALLRRYPHLKANLVVSGLPTHSEAVLNGFLAAVQPRMIIIVDAAYPATARAGRDLRARLARWPADVIYTRESGAVEIQFFEGGYELRSSRGERRIVQSPSPKLQEGP